PVIEETQIQGAAEFGIVFLLFTIGLNFSLPQIHSLRHLVLGLGTGQVVLTTAVIGVMAWLADLPPAAAFVIGAVFAQSSTTIISKQLAEQGEENSRHGRLGTAMSVFQDVTAVPLVVVMPVLGMATTVEAFATSLAWAVAKAVLAFASVFLAGRWLLRPLFHAVASRRSAELFTLTVLLVSLGAAWITLSLGLSMAFGAFLVGMMLGDTEFRHQVESTIRPFRDVLLGLFFVSIGMLFDPSLIPNLWPWALAGAVSLLSIKTLLVMLLVRWAGIDALTAWRIGFLVAVGGEFGFALLAIALAGGIIAPQVAQIALTAVLFSMVAAPLLIRYNHGLAARLTRRPEILNTPDGPSTAASDLCDHAIICGYGRIGQNVGHVLEEENIAYVALDLDPTRVRDARIAGEPVFYGDSTDRGILEAAGIGAARLVVISYEDIAAALKVLGQVRALRPNLPIMVRTRDESHVEQLRTAGATEVVPETLEAGLMIASQALLLLDVPISRVVRRIREERARRYLLLREFFPGDSVFADNTEGRDADRLQPVFLPSGSRGIGRTLAELSLDGVVVTALVRQGSRELGPVPETRLQAGDVVVLFGSPEDLQGAEERLSG
nr:cation:proton antiporter [Methylotetracoccus sp.]